jgi:hypothetical protein
MLPALAEELGVDFYRVANGPQGPALELRKPRVGLWDQYGGSIPSGWVRFILERFGYDFELVFPQQLDAGDLEESFDVLIFPDGGIPGVRAGGMRGGGYRGDRAAAATAIPAEYQDRLGSVTAETTVPQLRAFLEAGGTIITLEGSTSLAYHLGLPISDYLVDDEGNPLRPEEFFVPGSLLEVSTVTVTPVLAGMPDAFIVNFARSPVFAVEPGVPGLRVLAEYGPTPLRSGWAWGQEKLQGGAALVEADVGAGTLYLFGPQVTFRGQPYETFPLVFNGILLGAARETTLR